MRATFVLLPHKSLDTPEWVESLRDVVKEETKLYETTVELIGNLEVQTEEGAIPKDNIFFLLPFLILRLCALHTELDIFIGLEDLDFTASLWRFICLFFVIHQDTCKHKKKAQEPQEPEWDWIDSEIVRIRIKGINKETHIHDFIVMAIEFFTKFTIAIPQFSFYFFETLIHTLVAQCTDDDIALKIVYATRKIVESGIEIRISNAEERTNGAQEKILAALQEQVRPECEKASNAVLQLICDYLEGIGSMRDSHMKLFQYSMYRSKGKEIKLKDRLFELFNQKYGGTVYSRLSYIFAREQWNYDKEPKDYYWIPQAMELLLSVVDENALMSRMDSNIVLLKSSEVGSGISNDESGGATDIKEIERNGELARIMDLISCACNEYSTKKTSYWFRPLRKLLNFDIKLADKLWTNLFSKFWTLLNTDETQQLAQSTESFFVDREIPPAYNKKFNLVRTVFKAINSCNPAPRITPEFISFLAEKFGIWDVARQVLEAYTNLTPASIVYPQSLIQLLKRLGEEDYLIGLQRYMATDKRTLSLLSYRQFHMWDSMKKLLLSDTEIAMEGRAEDEAQEQERMAMERIIEAEERIEEGAEEGIEERIEEDVQEIIGEGVEEGIEEGVEEHIDEELMHYIMQQENVDEEIEENIDLEEDIEGNIEEDIEGNVEENIEGNVEEEIEGNIEENIEEDVEENIEENIEANMEGNIEEYIEANMEENVEGNVEGNVEENIEENVEGNVEGKIEENIEPNIEGNIEGNIERNVEGNVEEGYIEGDIGEPIEADVGENVEYGMEDILDERAGEEPEEREDNEEGNEEAISDSSSQEDNNSRNSEHELTEPAGIERNLEDTEEIDLMIWRNLVETAEKKLGQWESYCSLAKDFEQHPLILDSHWCIRDWSNYISKTADAGINESVSKNLAILYSSFQQNLNDDKEPIETYQETIELIHKEWNALPDAIVPAHYDLLVKAQQLYEIGEYHTMAKSFRKPPENFWIEFNDSMNSWKYRLPSKMECHLTWKELLGCRNYLLAETSCALRTANYTNVDLIKKAEVWNLLQLTKVARKQGLKSLALQYSQEAAKIMATNRALYIFENLANTFETVKLVPKTPEVLQKIEKHLAYMETLVYSEKDNECMSEIKRYRGRVQFELEETTKACAGLKCAIELNMTNYKAWKSLAFFHEAIYEKQGEIEDNIHTLEAFMHTIILKPSKAKLIVPKILQCLEYCGNNELKLLREKSFEELHKQIPAWIWINWIPELLENLEQSTAQKDAAELSLKAIVALDPLRLFVPIKNFKKQLSSNTPAMPVIKKLLDEILDNRKACTQIERILDELENRILFTPSKEAELLLAFKYVYSLCDPNLPIATFHSCFCAIAVVFFHKGNTKFNEKYGKQFKEDFITRASEKTMIMYMNSLLRWMNYLESLILTNTPSDSIDQYSTMLPGLLENVQMFRPNNEEEAWQPKTNTVYIKRIKRMVQKSTKGTWVTFSGSDFKDYSYYLQVNLINKMLDEIAGKQLVTESEELLMKQASDFITSIINNDRHTIPRNVKLHSPFVFNWNNMKVSLANSKLLSMETLHNDLLTRIGLSVHNPLFNYTCHAARVNDETLRIGIRKATVRAMRKVVPCNYFCRYISSIPMKDEDLLRLKKQFTEQLASQSLFSYLLDLGPKDLNSLMFCKKTGRIMYMNQESTLGKEYTVPFRLTKNLTHFIGPIGVKGVFAGGMTAVATALVQKLKYWKSYLRIYYKNMLKKENIEEEYERSMDKLNSLVDVAIIESLSTSSAAELEGDLRFDHGVHNIIETAQNEGLQDAMPIQWVPWF